MESAMEPMQPKIIETVNDPNMFFVRFRTCLQSFDCFNRNKRNYNLRPMMEAIKADHIQELLYKGTWCGENGHPDSTDIKRILPVSSGPYNVNRTIVFQVNRNTRGEQCLPEADQFVHFDSAHLEYGEEGGRLCVVVHSFRYVGHQSAGFFTRKLFVVEQSF